MSSAMSEVPTSNAQIDSYRSSSAEALLSAYGRALALTADASPAERTRALQSLALDEAAFAALSAEGDAAVNRALETRDVAKLLAFKTSFEIGRAAVDKERAARGPSVAPPVAARTVAAPPIAPPPARRAARRCTGNRSTGPGTRLSLSDSGIALVGSLERDEDAPETEEHPEALHTAARELSLMQYAALRADVLGSPDHLRPAVLARYGRTPEGDIEEAARWNARFRENRNLFDEYMRIFTYLRGLARR